MAAHDVFVLDLQTDNVDARLADALLVVEAREVQLGLPALLGEAGRVTCDVQGQLDSEFQELLVKFLKSFDDGLRHPIIRGRRDCHSGQFLHLGRLQVQVKSVVFVFGSCKGRWGRHRTALPLCFELVRAGCLTPPPRARRH